MILLDTHSLIWWVSKDKKLSPAALAAIQDDGLEILVSSMTIWEIALLVTHGRIGLSKSLEVWIATVEKIDKVAFIPVDNDIAVGAITLPGDFHKDPADRIIIATARKFGAPIVTADDKIRGYPHVRTIW